MRKLSSSSLRNAIAFSFAIFAINASSQITLDAGDLPALGDIIYTASPQDVNIDVGIAGANQIWDFSDMIPAVTDTTNFVSIAGTPAELEFQNSDMVIQGGFDELLGFDLGDLGGTEAPDATLYLSQNADGNIEIDGINTTLDLGIVDLGEQNLISTNPILIFTHLDYGDSTQVVGNFDIPVDLGGQAGVLRLNFDRKIVADAWGNITTPLGSWDCIRHKEITTISPEIGTLFGPIFIPLPGILPDSLEILNTAFSFVAEEMNYPILIANGTEDAINTVKYQADPTDLPAPIAAFEIEANCLVYNFTNNSVNATTNNWDFGNGATSVLANTDQVYANAGEYTVTLIVGNGITTDTLSQIIIVDDCATNILETEFDNLNAIYNNNTIVINNPSFVNDLDLTILDLNGKVLKSIQNINNQEVINVDYFNNGVYLVRFSKENLNKVEKIVLNR